jgi:hypothetical protein
MVGRHTHCGWAMMSTGFGGILDEVKINMPNATPMMTRKPKKNLIKVPVKYRFMCVRLFYHGA